MNSTLLYSDKESTSRKAVRSYDEFIIIYMFVYALQQHSFCDILNGQFQYNDNKVV